MTPAEREQNIFNGLILDPGDARLRMAHPTPVTFSVNPEMTFTVEYPPATPECFAARHTELQIEKTASVDGPIPASRSPTRWKSRT